MYPSPQIWRPVALMGALVAATLFATSSITVAPGDTLSEIAERHGVAVSDLMVWNGLDDADLVLAGTALIVSDPGDTASPAKVASGGHVVTAGDTLTGIAARFGTSVARLVASNGLDDPDRIVIGQTLNISGDLPAAATTTTAAPRTHTVVAGDSLNAIAAAFGVKPGVLAADNGIADPDLIVIGMVLTIGRPAATAPADTTTTTAPPTTTTPTTTTEAAPTTTTTPAATTESTVRPADSVLLVPIFAKWAEAYDVPQDLLEAIAWRASNWVPGTVGAGGQLGVMQLRPETVDLIEGGLLGKQMNPMGASDSVQMGARYLRYLLDRTTTEREAIAAWGQGLRSVQDDGVSAAGDQYADSIEEIRRQRS